MSAQAQRADTEPIPNIDPGRREYLLAAMRVALTRLKLAQADIEEIGLALKHKMIGPDAALEWAHGIGVLQYIPSRGNE